MSNPLAVISLCASLSICFNPVKDVMDATDSMFGKHEQGQYVFEPYLENAKHPHMGELKEPNWSPYEWTKQAGSEAALISDFYRAEILKDQYVDDGVHFLEVGPAFYRLGGRDKNRVVETVDQVFNITGKHNGMFMIVDSSTDKTIGLYTKYGLQIQ